MRPLGLLASVLCASLLVRAPALAQSAQRTTATTTSATSSITSTTTTSKDATVRPPQRVSLLERTSAYHLPTYMMHLYRNFRANFSSRPLDVLEREAVKQQADTVKSLVAKSKFGMLSRKKILFYKRLQCLVCVYMLQEKVCLSVCAARRDAPGLSKLRPRRPQRGSIHILLWRGAAGIRV